MSPNIFLRFRSVIFIAVAMISLSCAATAQAPAAAPTPVATPSPTATPLPVKLDTKNLTADQVAEFAIIFYGGRPALNQIRKTATERGISNIRAADGRMDKVPYTRFVIRADTLAKEKIRLDQEYPSARFSLVQADERFFGVYNNTIFQPAEEALNGFRNQIYHGIEALLRYSENGSKLALVSRDKVMGVEYNIIDMTDTQGRVTRFYISAKSFRVMMLTYEQNGVKYRRKFYDYNAAQGTLVPFRTVLWADDKQVEETEVGTITFGQKVDEGLFSGS